MLEFDRFLEKKNVNIYVDNDYLLTANVGKEGVIKVSKKHKIGRILVDAINMGEGIRISV